jgi:hypothetical protein
MERWFRDCRQYGQSIRLVSTDRGGAFGAGYSPAGARCSSQASQGQIFRSNSKE